MRSKLADRMLAARLEGEYWGFVGIAHQWIPASEGVVRRWELVAISRR